MKTIGKLIILLCLASCNSVTHVKKTSVNGDVTEWDGINSAFVRRKNHTSRITRVDGTILEDFGDEDQTRAGSLMLWNGLGKVAIPEVGKVADKAIPKP